MCLTDGSSTTGDWVHVLHFRGSRLLREGCLANMKRLSMTAQAKAGTQLPGSEVASWRRILKSLKSSMDIFEQFFVTNTLCNVDNKDGRKLSGSRRPVVMSPLQWPSLDISSGARREVVSKREH